MNLVTPHEHLEAICRAIADRLKDLAQRRSCGEITEQAFIEAVLKLEAEAVRPNGMTLTSSNTLDDWTVFQIKIDGTHETCAAFEFLPETGEFRRAGHCGNDVPPPHE